MLNILLLSVKKIYITWHIRNKLLLKKLIIRKCLTNMNNCIKKIKELGGDDDDGVVEYGNDFLNCKIIDSKQT